MVKRRAFLVSGGVMHGIKSHEGRWSVCLCNCSPDTAHFHYGNVVLHILLDDLRDLGLATERVADAVDEAERLHDSGLKKGMVQ
jgi:hypothetical protein